jgi:hypothetical protein
MKAVVSSTQCDDYISLGYVVFRSHGYFTEALSSMQPNEGCSFDQTFSLSSKLRKSIKWKSIISRYYPAARFTSTMPVELLMKFSKERSTFSVSWVHALAQRIARSLVSLGPN